MTLLDKIIKEIKPLDNAIMEEAQEKLNALLKPAGSLGKLEDLVKQNAGITGNIYAEFKKKAVIVMAADNGVYEEGVGATPQAVSLLVADAMTRNLAGVSVLAAHAGAEVFVVDVGLLPDVNNPDIINKKIRHSTGNIRKEPAMTREEALKGLEVGIQMVMDLSAKGYDIFATGEVGICNTTTSSAILKAISGEPIESLTGRGAGLTDEAYENKKRTVDDAVRVNKPDSKDPIDILSKVGGLDIAGMAGCFLGAAYCRKPILMDGFISGAAAVLATMLNPLVKDFIIPSHGTAEPGRNTIMKILDKEPMLLMNMRLGEGTGAALAFHLVDASSAMMRNMGTFADIGM